MPFDSTIAGPTANSYAPVAEADTYFASHWDTAKANTWVALQQAQKERLLMSGTSRLETLRVLDQEIGGSIMPLPTALWPDVSFFNGQIMRYDAEQALQFPRNIDVKLTSGAYTPFIPEPVKEALFEQAIYLMAINEDVLAAQALGLEKQSAQAGTVNTYESYTGRGTTLAPMAVDLMRQYIRTTRRLNRG